MPIDLYGLVHKGQRYRLFQFAQELSHADLTQTSARTWATNEVTSLVEHLRDHAHNEECYIHPLYARCGNVALSLDAEHAQLEAGLAALIASTKEPQLAGLYSAVMRFIGVYLLHLDAEEAAQRDILWIHCTDSELMAVMTRFKAERDPLAAQADLTILLPAMTLPELQTFVANSTRQMSDPEVRKFEALVQSCLGATRWASLSELTQRQ
jgi:hypothetical protein